MLSAIFFMALSVKKGPEITPSVFFARGKLYQLLTIVLNEQHWENCYF